MCKASKHKERSQESEYLISDHGRRDEEGCLVENGVAEAGQALIESQSDREVIKGLTSSLAQV